MYIKNGLWEIDKKNEYKQLILLELHPGQSLDQKFAKPKYDLWWVWINNIIKCLLSKFFLINAYWVNVYYISI